MPTYETLMTDLYNNAGALKNHIDNTWRENLPEYTNILGDVDAWLRQLDTIWAAIDLVNPRLTESTLMKNKGKLYAANWSPWLRNIAPLTSNESYEQAVNKSASLIVEHASRRVDLYFIQLLCLYNTSTTIEIVETNRTLQHVSGSRKYRTEACHSAIISNFNAKLNTGLMLPTGPYLSTLLNTTVELPKIVNDFDKHLEGKIKEELQSSWRKTALDILHKTSLEAHEYEPRKALLEFLLCMVEFFSNEEIKSKFWSKNASIHNKLVYLFQCVGTCYFLWSSKQSIESYIHLQLRLKQDEIDSFRQEKFFRINKYKSISNEINGSTQEGHWLYQFFSTDLTDVNKREFLKGDEFTLDVLDNLLCFERTFEPAMNILASLADIDDDDICHIQYRVNLAFSPMLGSISYEQRLAYLKRQFAETNEQSVTRRISLLRSLFGCIGVYTLNESCPEYGSPIYLEDINIEWGFPKNPSNEYDDSQFETYCLEITKLIVVAATCSRQEDLSNKAIELAENYIDENIGNLLVEGNSRKIINLFLIDLPTEDTDNGKYINIENIITIYQALRVGDKDMLRSDVSDEDALCFQQRINDFYFCIAINRYYRLLRKFMSFSEQDIMAYDWYMFSQENEEIIYVYDHFNGVSSWVSSFTKIVTNFTKIKNESRKELFNNVISLSDRVNELYFKIKQSGMVPPLLAYDAKVADLAQQFSEMTLPKLSNFTQWIQSPVYGSTNLKQGQVGSNGHSNESTISNTKNLRK